MKALFPLLVASVTAARGSIIASVDKLDATDGLPLPSAHLVVVDLHVDVTPDELWSAAGTVAHASNGAALHYELDANGAPLVTAPGTENRFTTFFSRPRGRNDDSRFLPDSSVAIIGGTWPPGPDFRPEFLNVAYQEPFPPAGGDGYIARFVVDLSTVNDPAFRIDSADIVVSTSRPPGSVVLLESRRDQNGVTFVETFDTDLLILDWGVYGIPEPGSALLLFGGIMLLRRYGR